jgi:hypothetical protein
MHPTWPKPRGSLAQKCEAGIPRTGFSGLAFQGRRQSPITTSSTSAFVPSTTFGSLHGQQ